ncbi:MAG: hypothetical protein FWH08_03945 [Oscillospiraceae bacterium]|nr:hypothetical protein [Oscillospiraceae bacterium]
MIFSYVKIISSKTVWVTRLRVQKPLTWCCLIHLPNHNFRNFAKKSSVVVVIIGVHADNKPDLAKQKIQHTPLCCRVRI